MIINKQYIIEIITTDEGKIKLRRTNRGFSSYELLGLIENLKMDIHNQINGLIEPDIVERIVEE
jgi:hypothetical protein